MARTVRTRWTHNPTPPKAPGAEWVSFLDREHRDVGCRKDCGTCGKPQAKQERRRIRRGKRDAIREGMSQ